MAWFPASALAQGAFVIEPLGGPGDVLSTCLALDAQDNPHIAYYNASSHTLWYASRAGGVWLGVVADNGPHDVGGFLSLALDNSGTAHIAYFDETTDDLKYASGSGTNWAMEMVDSSAADLGRYCALALDAAGNPHVSYWDASALDLKYAHKSGGSWIRETVDAPGFVGLYTAIALDASGSPHIAYYDDLNDDLKYARKSGGAWTAETVDAPGSLGTNNAIALDAFGNPHVSYGDGESGNLKVAIKSGGVWIIETVDGSPNDVGSFQTSIALDAYGDTHISYYDATAGDLKYARRTNGTWVTQVVDAGGTAGAFSSIRLNAAGEPRFSYQESVQGELRFASLVPDQEVFQGITNRALGNATLALQGPRLVVDNIGSSGQDGITFAGPHQSFGMQWRPLGDIGSYVAGAFIEIGAIAAPPNPCTPPNPCIIPPSPCRLTGSGPRLEFTADFSAVGSPTRTVQVRAAGVPLLERTLPPNPCAQVQTWPISVGSLLVAPATATPATQGTDAIAALPRPGYSWRWASGIPITLSATATAPETTLTGDELRILAGAPTVSVGQYAGLRLLVKDIPTLRIEQEAALTVGVGKGATAVRETAWVRTFPNPSRRGRAQVVLSPRFVSGEAEIAVFDLAGRRVRTLLSGAISEQPVRVRWDGMTEAGRPAPVGIYVVRFVAGGVTRSTRLVVLE